MAPKRKPDNTEIVAEIKNKLQPAKAVLDLLSSGKKPPKKLIDSARKELDKAVGLLRRL